MKECHDQFQTPNSSPCSSSCPFKSLTNNSKYAVEDIISGLSFILVFSLLQLPYEKIDGNPVPTVIFNNRPSLFHAFVLGLNFAFCGGVMTISLRQLYPKVAAVCRCVCVMSMLIAAGIIIGLAVPWVAGDFFPHASPAVAAA